MLFAILFVSAVRSHWDTAVARMAMASERSALRSPEVSTWPAERAQSTACPE